MKIMRKQGTNQLTIKGIRIFLVFVMLLNAVGCSKEKEEPIEKIEEPVQYDTEITVEEPDVTIPEVIDENGTYIQDSDCLACVIIHNLRQRTSPEGDIITNTYDDSPIFVEPRCYKEYETKVIGEYKWIRIGDDRWIGTKPEWVVETTREELRSPYEINDRHEYTDEHGFGLNLTDDYDITSLYPMDEEELRLSLILKRLVPCIRYEYAIDFDARNPSERAISALFHQISEVAIPFSFLEEDQLQYPEVISDYLLKGGARFHSGRASYMLQEDMDCYTKKYYGSIINFSTIPYVYFDALNHVYYYEPPTGYGYEDGYPVVLDYSVNGDVTEITFIPVAVSYDGSMEKSTKLTVYYEGKWYEKEEAVPLMENEMSKYKATLQLSEEGVYQLITVQELP